MTFPFSHTTIAALFGLLTMAPQAGAFGPAYDLRVFILNGSDRRVEFCGENLLYCEQVLPGRTNLQVFASGGQHARLYATWSSSSVIRVCGVVIATRELLAVPRIETNWWGGLATYQTSLVIEKFPEQCRASPPGETAPSAGEDRTNT